MIVNTFLPRIPYPRTHRFHGIPPGNSLYPAPRTNPAVSGVPARAGNPDTVSL
jgi:hypothetical protein